MDATLPLQSAEIFHRAPTHRKRTILGHRRVERTLSTSESDTPTAKSHALMRMELIHRFCRAIFNIAPQSLEATIQFSGSTHQGLKSKSPNQAAHRFPFGTVRTNIRDVYIKWIVSGNRHPRMVKRLHDYGINVEEIKENPSEREVAEIFDRVHFHDILCVKSREFGVATQGTDDLHQTINQADSQMERYFRGREVQEICKQLMIGSITRDQGERELKEKLTEYFDQAVSHLTDVQQALNSIAQAATTLSEFTPSKPQYPDLSPTKLRRDEATVNASGGRGMGRIVLDFSVADQVENLKNLWCQGAACTPQRELVTRTQQKLEQVVSICQDSLTTKVAPRLHIYQDQNDATRSFNVPSPDLTPVQREKEKDLSRIRQSLEKKPPIKQRNLTARLLQPTTSLKEIE